jgi:Isocitrate/isopropylmalate dehydrogenase
VLHGPHSEHRHDAVTGELAGTSLADPTATWRSPSNMGIHDLIDVETVRAVADTAAELRDDLDKGGGVSGPAARDEIKIATRATQSGRGRRDRAPAGRLPAPEAARAADGIILGPVSHSDYPARDKGGINGSAHLRVQLDLYANIRPCRSREGLAHYGRTPLDLVIVRENTEGFYADRTMYMGTGEYMPTPDVAIAMRKVTAKGPRRIAKIAFELARARPRRKPLTAAQMAKTRNGVHRLTLRAFRFERAAAHPRRPRSAAM